MAQLINHLACLRFNIQLQYICSVEAAYAAFSQARPPGIIKGHYIEELYARYGAREDAPAPPPLPTWYTESDDSLGMSISFFEFKAKQVFCC